MKHILLLATGLLWFGVQLRAADKVDFTKDIQPILQQSCIKCHGPEKQKSKLRLDSREAALKGGKGGPALVVSDAGKSDLYRRIILPKGNDDVMPNEGDLLTKAQTDLIRLWIDQGAVWPEAAAAKAGEGKPAESAAPTRLANYTPGSAEQKAVAKLESLNVSLRPIAMNSNWREANLRLLGTNANDALLANFKDVLGLVELNLATTKITDAGLANLAGLTNLSSLNLSQTAVTDAGLAQLKNLVNLEYLNLYGTAVTDAGLTRLKGLPRLKNLYVWQTKVTEAGVKTLKAALPKVDVNTGWDLSALPKPEEKKDEKKAEAPKKEEKKEEKKPEAKKEEKKADDKK